MSKLDEKVDELKKVLSEAEVNVLERMKYRLSDAIREGSMVSEKAEAWGDGDTMCAMHAAVCAAKARDYM